MAPVHSAVLLLLLTSYLAYMQSLLAILPPLGAPNQPVTQISSIIILLTYTEKEEAKGSMKLSLVLTHYNSSLLLILLLMLEFIC